MNVIFTIFILLLFYILLTPNAIHALLALILIFINFSILLFILDSSFLAFSYVLVYIGAICVLFLYIILLLHLRTHNILQRTNMVLLLSLIIGFITVFLFINKTDIFPSISTTTLNVSYLSDLTLFMSYLFITHQIYLLFGTLLLLVALVLSIFLSISFIRPNELAHINKLIKF
jgi:NADH:ubiquinone oxidoreductase subunit 6 (subunit J)